MRGGAIEHIWYGQLANNVPVSIFRILYSYTDIKINTHYQIYVVL